MTPAPNGMVPLVIVPAGASARSPVTHWVLCDEGFLERGP